MANQNNSGYRGQQNSEGNIQAKSGQKVQSNNQSNKQNAGTTNVGSRSTNKSGRSDSDNQE